MIRVSSLSSFHYFLPPLPVLVGSIVSSLTISTTTTTTTTTTHISMPSLQEQFDAAAEKARHTSGVSNDTKKQIYGLFKQATEGDLPKDKPRPGLFDPSGRAKYDGWKALNSVTKEDAMTQYVALIESL
jgi:diazepam-binding inhibitor (GABA receptor modulating acyl-CoA-binding protein)